MHPSLSVRSPYRMCLQAPRVSIRQPRVSVRGSGNDSGDLASPQVRHRWAPLCTSPATPTNASRLLLLWLLQEDLAG